jgi:putative nucleotidyltransferase with HDIG domain
MAAILLVGANRGRTGSIRSILRGDGHRVRPCRAVAQWSHYERETQPDLVVAAVDSIAPVIAAGRPAGRGFRTPILWVDEEGFSPCPFRRDRLVDRLGSPFAAGELLGRVDGLVRVQQVMRRQPVAPLREKLEPAFHRDVGGWFARKLRPEEVATDPREPYQQVAQRVAEWADRRDAFEPGHADRVASLCMMMAEGLDMPEGEAAALLRAAMLHDIGKIAIPVELLHQRTPLDHQQTQLIRTHARKGASLLRALDSDHQVADAILYHHERPDGNGYYGEWADVPRTARALAVAEVYDAMLSSQVGDTHTVPEALDRLVAMKGKSLDSDCVEALAEKLRPRARSIPLSPLFS